ncbi:UNVERIFIED_CONTAM: hypothetical protein Sradi_7077900 [Sesamum radiatum]|uniref:Endonuclease/exonuclease/phosphatase domain-containing protein n=1 Tax=Sesamum radiatum TaxID=300843 RepID=A0AAW2J3Z8_SESRA
MEAKWLARLTLSMNGFPRNVQHVIAGPCYQGLPHDEAETPPVSVYVQKPTGQRRITVTPHGCYTAALPPGDDSGTAPEVLHGGAALGEAASENREDKGKAIVLYNAFDTLMELDSDDAAIQGPNSSPFANLMINAAVWNVRGLNRRDHQVSVTDLITEHCLHFIGLLETRVAVGNVARVQRGMLPQWLFYVDYGGPGNRVWLAWDSNFVDVTVVETGAQFIHCSVFIRSVHSSVFVTVVYGVNDVIGRRSCGPTLHVFTVVTDTPWLVGGDFNTVLDSSEVCGLSGDIRGLRTSFGVPARYRAHTRAYAWRALYLA